MPQPQKPAPRTGQSNDGYGALGARLRHERELEGMSIAEVAEAVNVTKPHVSMIEKGVNKPGPKLLAKFENLYGIMPGELFAIVGQARPKERQPTPKESEQTKDQTDERYGGIIGHREGLITGTLANAIHGTKLTIDILDSWIGEDLDRLKGPFREAVGRGVQIRFILMHPGIAPDRVRHMEFTSTYTDSAAFIAHANIGTLIMWYQDWRDNWDDLRQERNERRKVDTELVPWSNWQDDCMQLRLLPFVPSIQYHRYDDKAFVGFFLHIEHSRQGPQLEIALRRKEPGYLMRTTFGRSFVDEFTYLWELLEAAPSAHVDLQRPFDHAGWNNAGASAHLLPDHHIILTEIDRISRQKKAH